MTGPERKYVLDTNLFIDGFRDARANEALQQFHRLFAPFEYLSAVVAHELRCGARAVSDRHLLEKHVLLPFAKRGRVVTPSPHAWERGGDALSELARADGAEPQTVSRAFAYDVLLALSCREAGMTLVTRNLRDFERIAGVAPFRFVGPWPAPVA